MRMIALAASAALLSSLANVAEVQNAESLSGTSGRYAAVMEAYLSGLETLVANGGDPSPVIVKFWSS